MSEPLCPRGSEWRRWDLQVHTPFSALNNGFGQDFDHYAKTVFEKAIENKIAVIGVTDYFCIDGYKHLLALRDDVASLSALIGEDHVAAARRILLVPNIELRTSVIVTRPGRRVRVVAIIDGTVCRVIDGRDIDCNARGHRTGSFPFPLPAFV